ncbi:MAG TPA: hypothetical protein VLU25_05990 [Acidobacteriota bacterium]|nr:hypothetical protein [Acidobacteriota bacterium]
MAIHSQQTPAVPAAAMPVNLQALQDRLYEDEALRESFRKDPVKVLRDSGMQLTEEMEENLRHFVQKAQAPAKFEMQDEFSEDIAIVISISIPF